MSDTLSKFGLSPDAAGLLRAQELYLERANALSDALDAARGKVSEVVDTLGGETTDAITADVESVREHFFSVSERYEARERAVFLLAAIEAFSTLADYADGEVQEFAASTLTEGAAETLNNASELYNEAAAIREFANTAFTLFAQLGMVPSELKVTTRKVRNGEATVLDWPRITDPSGVSVSTGKRSYTKNLPVWNVDGNELPHGTTARTVAVSHLSTKDAPLNASALLDIIEKNVGKDYRKTGGTVVIRERVLTFTEWREVN